MKGQCRTNESIMLSSHICGASVPHMWGDRLTYVERSSDVCGTMKSRMGMKSFRAEVG
ncbi:MAG: hypothetical protein LUG18_08590 [Candidatus Azobacteroides sp.]|nr:hypothetical protein [Candidatus Azobacteroides sp.]